MIYKNNQNNKKRNHMFKKNYKIIRLNNLMNLDLNK